MGMKTKLPHPEHANPAVIRDWLDHPKENWVEVKLPGRKCENASIVDGKVLLLGKVIADFDILCAALARGDGTYVLLDGTKVVWCPEIRGE